MMSNSDGHLILNYDQVTKISLQLAPPSPNFHATPTRGHWASTDLVRIRSFTRWIFNGTRLEVMTRQSRVRDHNY
ncbi:hypothetical protein TNCV_4536351 [Trichonephila clavipes]|nr:hypothetical protein TNCV_4536351 [Trichonephila clavipes]